jgi:hypothetical protein
MWPPVMLSVRLQAAGIKTNEEREQISLNQLLTEMDFNPSAASSLLRRTALTC